MRVLLALLAIAGLGLTGCGSEDEEAAGGGETIEVSETDFRLEPATITLEEGGTYTFRAVNDGAIDHALEVEGEGVEEETATIGPGESAELTVDLATGTYELYCPIGTHRDQGMDGSIEVAGGAGGATTGETETDESEPADEPY